jgi:hypothetical protein
MELKGGRTTGWLRHHRKRRRDKGVGGGKEKYKKRKNLACTYSTSKMPCFPISCAQHMENVAMDSNDQPGYVQSNPVRQESDRHNCLAVELEMKNYHNSNTKYHSLHCCRYKHTKCYCSNYRHYVTNQFYLYSHTLDFILKVYKSMWKAVLIIAVCMDHIHSSFMCCEEFCPSVPQNLVQGSKCPRLSKVIKI